MPPSSCAALIAAAVIAVCAASTPCNQVHLGVSGRIEISSPPQGGECSALVLPRWHYPAARSAGLPEAPQVEVVDILDGSGRVVCAGTLVASDWVLTAGSCARLASEVQVWGVQRVSVRAVLPDPQGGAEAVALLRLEHAVCSRALRMDDGSNIGAGSCRALLVELVQTLSKEGSASNAARWNESMRCVPFDNRTTDVQTWIADMMDANAMLANSTDGGAGHSGQSPSRAPVAFTYEPACPNAPASTRAPASPLLCAKREGDAPGDLTTNVRPPLLGSPLVARGTGEPLAAGVLVGVLTDNTIASSLKVARVSSIQNWILAVANLSASPPLKLVMEVTSFDSRGTATVHVHRGPSPYDPATTLDSDCGAPVTEDDGGRGGILLRIATNSSGEEGGDNATRLPPSDALPPSVVATWRAVTCAENWQGQGGSTLKTPGQCDNPSAGGIEGCAYIPAEDAQGGGAQGGACVEAGCRQNLTWGEVQLLEKAGLATVGGLGKSAVMSGSKRYKVWMCVRGWDAHVQRSCGAGPQDYSCWRFEEANTEWEFLGINMYSFSSDETLRARERAQIRVLESVLPTSLVCPGGSVSPLGSTGCRCKAGFTGPDGGACTACSAGTYTGDEGSATCVNCPADTYSLTVGASAVSTCLDCPAGTVSNDGSSSVDNCTCAAGFVSDGGGGCFDPTFFDLAAAPDFPSSHTFPGPYATRALVANADYDAGSMSFVGVDISNTATRKYSCAVLTPSGTIVMGPASTPSVGLFDPATNIFSTVDLSAIMPNANWEYQGGVLGANGKVYFVPHMANNVGVFDPATSAFSIVDITGTISTTAKYSGGVLAPNGIIYFTPNNADNVGVFDPATNASSVIDITGTISGDAKYFGAVLAPNGKIYFAPNNADSVGVLDPATDAFSIVVISGTIISGDGKFAGGVLAPNGKIYFAPRNAGSVGVFDPTTSAFSIVDISGTISTNNKYNGGVLASNGKIYFTPHGVGSVGVFDPATNAFSVMDIAPPVNGAYWGAALAPNGKIVFAPLDATNVGIFDTGNSSPAYTVTGGVPQEWRGLLSPYFNKY